ncbi:hypothetical protein B0H63DRAFT_463969 [Podospora didyma]|uniref:Mid2 domain-containing protein n=1 Tax=Podospora didyma TaxID=330526 RepID=A0AAE0NXQ7_9PEZI|nr:hypothetical protein B0H63DRAFT_463969 [Podospora didyma]
MTRRWLNFTSSRPCYFNLAPRLDPAQGSNGKLFHVLGSVRPGGGQTFGLSNPLPPVVTVLPSGVASDRLSAPTTPSPTTAAPTGGPSSTAATSLSSGTSLPAGSQGENNNISSSSSGGLSAGASAGVGIGAAVAVIALAAGLFVWLRKRQQQQQRQQHSPATSPDNQNYHHEDGLYPSVYGTKSHSRTTTAVGTPPPVVQAHGHIYHLSKESRPPVHELGSANQPAEMMPHSAGMLTPSDGWTTAVGGGDESAIASSNVSPNSATRQRMQAEELPTQRW